MLRSKAFHIDSKNKAGAIGFLNTSGVSPIRIMVFGDSNTFRPDGDNTRWTRLLNDKDPVNLHVLSDAQDGRTTRYDIDECNGFSVIRNKLGFYASFDYIIVMLGTNDVKNRYGPPSAAYIAKGMCQILDFIDKYGGSAKPIVITPSPSGEITSGELAGAYSRITSVAKEYRLLAMSRDIRLVDLNAIIDINTDLEGDKIHLNATGRQKVADAVWANLQNVKAPPQVMGLSGTYNGSKLYLRWNAVEYDTFYYRVRNNGFVISKTTSTSFEVTAPAIGDNFGVEAVDFSQNTGTVSVTIPYRGM